MDLERFVLANEAFIRLAIFLGVFIVIGLWELVAPRRTPLVSKAVRWIGNLGLVALNTVLLRVLFPLGAVGIAAFAVASGWGLLNYYQLPFWIAIIVAVVVLDLVIWLQHVMFHAVPVLWRVHRMHHADLDYDVTTGARFHPIEIVLSMLIKFATIAALGPPVLAVVIFEVLLNATAMFNHGNIRLPLTIDRLLRRCVVTPDMHRVHHSVEGDETNSNFGFNLSLWDRLFGTYRDQPRAGHNAMTIGIHSDRDPRKVNRLDGMLMLPFRDNVVGYTIHSQDPHRKNINR